jgi:hypothetical protein
MNGMRAVPPIDIVLNYVSNFAGKNVTDLEDFPAENKISKRVSCMLTAASLFQTTKRI